MFNIHELRLTQNFTAFDTVCKREKIDFFLMLDVVKLLQCSTDFGEYIFDKKIECKRIEDKKLLESVMKKGGKKLLEVGEDAFSVKPETYFLFKEMYDIQKESDKKASEFANNYKNVKFIM